MEITNKKKRKTIREVIAYNTDAGIKIKETFVDGERNKKLEVICSAKDKEGYIPVFLKEEALSEKAMREYKNFSDYIKEYHVELESIEDINKYKLYFAYTSSYMLFDENFNIISIPYIFSGSINEKLPNDIVYGQIIKLLKKHPYVLELEEVEIEHYNRLFSGQNGIELAKILLPQNTYKDLYEECKEIHKNGQYSWSLLMKDAMSLKSWAPQVYGDELAKLIKLHSESREYYDD